MPNTSPPETAVVGGSGFYSLLDDAADVAVETALWPTLGRVAVGRVAGRPVDFLPRHGKGARARAARDQLPREHVGLARRSPDPRTLRRCGLRDDVSPGDIVAPDQLVDRTYRRVQTYVEPGAAHVPFADPYCGDLGQALVATAPDIKSGVTMVVVEGPQFFTRAESRHYAAQGWTLIDVTGHPEAVLARPTSP